MLYTRKGDGGTTKTLHCDQRFSKSSAVAEALGRLDELNSWLGLCRAKNWQGLALPEKGEALSEILFEVQQNLFIIQAEVAGAKGKTIVPKKVTAMEVKINAIERELPPIKSFFIPGATEAGALLDCARTLSRRAERRVVSVHEEGKIKIGALSLAYLNRLSSLLYALARLANHRVGAKESAPNYK